MLKFSIERDQNSKIGVVVDFLSSNDLYDLKPSQRPSTMNSSWSTSRVRWFTEENINVSRTILVTQDPKLITFK